MGRVEWLNSDEAEGVGTEGKKGLIAIVVGSDDKGPVSSAEGVGRSRKGEAGGGRCGGAVGNNNPTNGADKVASSSGVDKRTLRKPVRKRITGVDGGVEGSNVLGQGMAGDSDDENTDWVGTGK
jgi:hypothetical protein